MTLQEIIFTTRPLKRYYRHIIFWMARYVFLMSASWMNLHLTLDAPAYDLLLNLLQIGVDMIFEMGYTYFVAYLLVPRLLQRQRYMAFTLALISCTFIIIILSEMGRYYTGLHNGVRFSFLSLWSVFWGYTGYGPPSICGLFLVIRMAKLYYKKVEEKEMLIRETANAESQLLKARVHPHFLFNTLNNIYSYTYDRPAEAADLAESLSGTMRYMIRDCEASLVPLQKELKMISDYIQLEKVRYGHRLMVDVSVEGDPAGRMIAPLLMIPFIENAFKHGASQMMDGSWIKIRIFIRGALLQMDVSNNTTTSQQTHNEKGGIGLTTVRKRLALLYPDSHQLKIEPGPGVFRILVTIPLQFTNVQSYEHRQQ